MADLEANDATTWNRTDAVFVGTAASLGLCFSAIALWNGFHLWNGRPLWIGLALPTMCLAGSSVAFWQERLRLAIALSVASFIIFVLWMPDR
jgi:hypothetical protein